MELEKEARHFHQLHAVLQFDYNGYRINLLDTRATRTFSEDTYRVLTPWIRPVMVIDSAKWYRAADVAIAGGLPPAGRARYSPS